MTEKEIIKLLEGFGLKVDYSQWDVKEKEWVRVSYRYMEEELIQIFYKAWGKKYINEKLAEFLIRIGRMQLRQELKALLNV